MRTLEQVTSKYGRSSRAVLELMAREGPGYLHAAAVPEANVAKFNAERGDELHFPLAFIIPAAGTIWANHPYCILDNADWVDPDEAEAAAIFRDYLLARKQQAMAIDHYIRPADPTIVLHAPLNLDNGVDPRVSPESVTVYPSPDSDVSAAVQDLFGITKRKATIIIVLDTSGSMNGEKIHSSTAATSEFLNRLDRDDEVAVMMFADDSVWLSEMTRARDVVEGLTGSVNTLIATGGTALYDSVCQATREASRLKAEDQANNESRLYGIILLSDGDDTASSYTENQMFVNCLPESAEIEGFKIFPIAFGDDSDQHVLQRMADVTGGRLFEADSDSISNVYLLITAEQ
jgi:Ca-activated chloride channel family protein